MAEHNASAGYVAIGKETTKGTPVLPSLFTPYYSQSIITNLNMMSDEPAYGSKFKRIQFLPGTRSHTGTIQVMAEPNTAASWFDMLTTKGSTTGSNPYTHPFGTSNTTDPKSYTMDISWGHDVIRFVGVEASKIGINWDAEKMVFDLDLSALKSFHARKIASVTGTGPTTLTLKTDGQYDRPTDGLKLSDTLHVYDVSAGTYINATVSGLPSNGYQITVTENLSAAAAGDSVSLRPQTPSLSLLTPFLYPKTQFYFSDTAANAQTASSDTANQTRLEPGTSIEIMHEFENNEGSKRSGSFDPASLMRQQYDATFKIKKFLDTPEQFADWAELTKQAMVMRAYSGGTNQYELRVTFNQLTAITDETPTDSSSVVMHEVEYGTEYKTADSQAFDVKVINARSSI